MIEVVNKIVIVNEAKIEELAQLTEKYLMEHPEDYDSQIRNLVRVNALLGARRALHALDKLLLGDDSDWIALNKSLSDDLK